MTTVTPKNENERIIARIAAVEDRLDGESKHVLSYVKASLAPEAIEARDEDDRNVKHLREVANEHLRRIERRTMADQEADLV